MFSFCSFSFTGPTAAPPSLFFLLSSDFLSATPPPLYHLHPLLLYRFHLYPSCCCTSFSFLPFSFSSCYLVNLLPQLLIHLLLRFFLLLLFLSTLSFSIFLSSPPPPLLRLHLLLFYHRLLLLHPMLPQLLLCFYFPFYCCWIAPAQTLLPDNFSVCLLLRLKSPFTTAASSPLHRQPETPRRSRRGRGAAQRRSYRSALCHPLQAAS